MNLKKLAQFISPRWREAQSCEACGEQFVCGAALNGCWCVGIKLSAEVRSQLRQRYQRCLCRHCLERFAQAQSPANQLTSSDQEPVDVSQGKQ